MRVVQLSTYHTFGGAAVAANRLHRALQKQGVDSTMLVGSSKRLEPSRPETGVVRLANSLLAEQMAFGRFVAERLYFLPYERDKSVRFQFSPAVTGADLTFHPVIQQADVLHLHWINFGFLSISGLKSLLLLGKPIVWTLHDMWAFTGGCHYSRGCDHFLTHCRQCPYLRRPSEQDLSYRVFEKKARLFAGANIHFAPPSHWLTAEAQRSTLLKEFSFTVVPYAIDQEVFRPIEREQAEKQFGLTTPNRTPRLLFGSFNTADPRKGFAYFSEALSLLQERLPQSISPEVLIFGKGKAGDFANLPFPVRHLGVITSEQDIVAAYNAADVMVVPSLEDNLPNTVIESLACGTPVIAFRTGGIPEMIDHEQNGYLADVGSATQLADGLYWLLTHLNPDELRQQARESAEQRFSEPVVAGQFIELYQRLISESDHRRSGTKE